MQLFKSKTLVIPGVAGILFACVGLLPGQTVKEKAAVAAFQYAAEHGDATAQYNLGLLYESGKLVERNPSVAAGWLRKAANLRQPKDSARPESERRRR